MKRFLILTMVLLALVFLANSNQYADNQNTGSSQPNSGSSYSKAARGGQSHDYVPGEILVKFKSSVGAQSGDIEAETDRVGFKSHLKENFSFIKAHRLELADKNMTVEDAIAKLKNNPNVEYAEPNYILRICATPNDPRYPQLWGLNNTGQTGGTVDADIDAAEAWDINSGSPDNVIAIIDTGADYSHEDLAANMWVNTGEIPNDGVDNDGNGYIDDIYGINSITNSGDPFDDNGHGSHTAGTIGGVGNNNIGVVGVNHNVKIMALKFLDATGSGFLSNAVKCINYAVAMKNRGVNVRVTSNSWGGGSYSTTLYNAIVSLRDNDILFIAAAGNAASNNDTTVSYPSGYNVANVIAVAATDHNDNLASFSSYGATTVDLAAPGVNILSTVNGGSYVPPQSGDLFFDNMESGGANWTAQSPWAITTEQNHTAGGANAWSDSPSANYGTSKNLTLTSNVINLSGVAGDLRLGFWVKGTIEAYYDYLFAEVSGNGGTSWSAIGNVTGSIPSWQASSFFIPVPYRTSNFRFRFRLFTDTSVVYDGVYIDDVGIGFGTGSNNYAYYNGTSMATPHVSGVAGLILSVNQALTYQQVKDILLNNVDTKASLSGKVLTGGRLNAYKSLSSIRINHAPVLASSGNQTIDENQLLTFTLSATDEDGDPLTYSAIGLPGGATLNSSSGVFTWTPSYSQSGSYLVTFRATDSGGLSDEKAITISVNNIDRLPVLTSPGDKAVDEGLLLAFTLSAIDPDGDLIVYTMSSIPSVVGASLNPSSGVFSWTPDYTQAGSYVVTFIATANSLTDSKTITIVVNDVAVNNPPVLTSPGNQTVNENQLLTFALVATDPDSNPLAYSSANLPTGATLNSSTGAFSWTPSYTQAGAYTVTFRATDSGGLYDEKTITITVNNVNRAPVLNAIGNKSATVGLLLTFTISATDPDNDALTYSAGNLPSGASFNAGTRTFSWTPTTAGTYSNVLFSVTDGSLSAQEAITITVTGLPPMATTGSASNITTSSARLNGTVNPKGLSTTVYFQWGTSTSYGNTTAVQVIGSGTVNVNVLANLTGLTRNKKYYYRIVAYNSAGTTYGSGRSFTTKNR